MLDRNLTRFDYMREVPVLTGQTFSTDGVVAQLAMEAGVRAARPSNATADTIFLGFTWGINDAYNTTASHVDSLKAVASVVTLTYPALSPTDIAVYRGTGWDGAALAYAAGAPAVNEFGLSGDGKTVTLNAADATANVFVVYRYAPTVAQAQNLWGELPAGRTAQAVFNRISVITSGEVFTDQFVPTVNWGAVDTVATAELLRGGAGGRVTIGGTGCILTGCHVIQAPTVDYPFLGIKVGRQA